ncbi:ras-related protein Rab-39B isoform X1 [Neopsephotus bourkii]|uniref:ras-related protein Rab-39B isoform X1 n=1 Tax=Neopsephotus bourkii TaxID=309878 RepID=UPI002AA5CE55|nr:ras-related protein Rab-39B isoform X1 [Neopsephotus bourkii]
MEAIWLYQFRLIVIGDSTVGKSCLIRRFTEGRFAQISDPTVGVDFFSRLVEIEPGKRIKLQIWDTAGQERFRSITRAYYRNSVGGLLLFDITNRRSFQNVHEWLEETKVHVQPYQIVFVLVGHKCDLDTQRQVTRHEAEKLAAAYGKQSWSRLLQSTPQELGCPGLPWADASGEHKVCWDGAVSPVFTMARADKFERGSSSFSEWEVHQETNLVFRGPAIHRSCPGPPH